MAEATSKTPVSTTEASKPSWVLPLLILICLMAGAVWYRGHTFAPALATPLAAKLWPEAKGPSEPLDCDEAVYAYIGHRLLQGDVMYRDLTENKPPLGYWIHAAAVAAMGYNEIAIRLMPIPFVLVTLALVWWIGLRVSGGVAATIAALLYLVLSTDPYLYGNGSSMEHFMNAFSTAALAAMIEWWKRGTRRWLVVAGLFLAAAALVKQVAILPALVCAIAVLLRKHEADPAASRPNLARWKAWLFNLDSLAVGLGLPIALAAMALFAQGAGYDAYEDIFRYGPALATDTIPEPNAPSPWVRWLTGNAAPDGKLPWPFGATNYLVWWGTGSWPLWLAAAPLTLWLFAGRRQSAERRIVAAWTLACVLQVVLPGLYWQHYYLLPVPGIALVVAIAFASAIHGLVQPRRFSSALVGLVLLVATSATIVMQVRCYLMTPPQELTVRYKGGGQWVMLRDRGREIAKRKGTWKNPRLFIWGWQSPLYFYGQIDGASRQVFVDNLIRDYADKDHPLITPRVHEIIDGLRANPPALIFAGYPPFPALAELLHERYVPSSMFPPLPNMLGLWVDRESFREFERSAPVR